jgi:hypothetical protein
MEDKPASCIQIFERTLLALFFLFAIGAGTVAVLSLDFPHAAPQPAVTGNGSPNEPAVAALSHPLPFTAVVMQSGPGIEKPVPRLYVPRSEK